jgi:uncharacterized protein YjbI with pentapeptide repeats
MMSSDADSWDDAEFTKALHELTVEGDIDAHDKTIGADELERVAAAARDYGGGELVLRANFRGATFDGAGHFEGATFKSGTDFHQTVFKRGAHFKNATFEGEADFAEARFKGETHFPDATFERSASFRDAVFESYAHFPNVTFGDRAEFRGADLKAGFRLGPALVLGGLVLDDASLGDLDMRVSTCRLSCRGTRFHGPAHVKVRWAEMLLEEAVFDRVSTLAFLASWDGGDEAALVRSNELRLQTPSPQGGTTRKRPSEMPRLISLTRADVGNLTLADIDLSLCDFQSTLRLDEMRLATMCPFDEAPSGRVVKASSLPFLWAWTKRITIHEERSWRVSTPKGNGWSHESVEYCVMRTRLASEAERLAKVYRALRKGREDEGNAPGAGDFYYGEMEMRRHGGGSRPERVVIWLYWLLSGYGLRASRALAALVITVIAFAVALYMFGLKSQDVGTALLQSVEGATLRSGDRKLLTPEGQGLQVALRLLGPLFFGLTLLALRGRVKR